MKVSDIFGAFDNVDIDPTIFNYLLPIYIDQFKSVTEIDRTGSWKGTVKKCKSSIIMYT